MKNKVVLVTGAARGIGREIALEFGRHGATVAVNYCSSQQQAKEVVDSIRSFGGRAETYKADIGNVSEIYKLFQAVEQDYNGLHIVVNNAGMMKNTPATEVSEQEFDRVFNLNVKGLFFCCQQAGKAMKDGGHIINIGTSVTKVMLPLYSTYAASKGAVEQLTKVFAKELGPQGIRVNTVSPGPTDTKLFREGKTEAQIASMAAMSAFNRLGHPEDIARVVVMMCRDEASWISGQNIFANGGFIA